MGQTMKQQVFSMYHHLYLHHSPHLCLQWDRGPGLGSLDENSEGWNQDPVPHHHLLFPNGLETHLKLNPYKTGQKMSHMSILR